MINSFLEIHGTYWVFSALTLIGTIFCFEYVEETFGLSDLEKKTLYTRLNSMASMEESEGAQTETETKPERKGFPRSNSIPRTTSKTDLFTSKIKIKSDNEKHNN